MTIQSVIDAAKTGELQNLAVKDDINAVLTFMNLGILELYKRFPLLVEEHIVTLHSDQVIYTMPDNFMWAVAAYDEVKDVNVENAVAEIPINEEDNPISINTISYNQIQVPLTIDGAFISIIYVAAPKHIHRADTETVINGVTVPAGSFWTYDTTYDSYGIPVRNREGVIECTTPKVVTNIDVPLQMMEALLHYVGYRAHGAVNGNVQAENNTHYQRFEMSCSRIEQKGMLTNDDLNMYDKFSRKVWA